MPRLIDDIRARGVQMPTWIDPLREREWVAYARYVLPLLADPDLTVLRIDNVADYYYTGTGQEYWDLEKDFPNLAPPFERFWCEHRLSGRIHSDEKGDNDMRDIIGKEACVGTYFMVVDPASAKTAEGSLPPGTRWIIWMDIFIQYDHNHGERANGPHGAMFICIDGDGRLLERPWMQAYVRNEHKELMKSLMTWLQPSFLAISFLHCKNVTITDETTPKPLAKKHHAKTGQWPVRYKTLVIEPLKQVLRTQGRSGEHGLAKAMHICRGHFRDYREGRGLFGKYKQLVWTPMTVRGTKGKAEDMPAREI